MRELVLQAASVAPDRPFLVAPDAGVTLTRRELASAVESLRAQLRAAGLAPGDRAALLLSNGPNLVVALLAVMSSGASAVPLHPRLAPDELDALVADAAPSLLISDERHRDVVPAATRERLALLREPRLEPGNPLLAAPVTGHDASQTWRPAASGPPALILFTSGTTGRPKGVPLGQGHLLENARQVSLAHALAPGDVALCVLPIFHVNGLVVTMLAPLLSGGTVVMPCRFEPDRFWALVAAHSVTWFSGVPTVLSALLARPGPSPAVLRALRFARSASAPLPVAVKREFEARFGVPVVESLGMSEAAGQVTSNPLPPAPRKEGSVGVAFGNELRVVDDGARPVATGTVGEVAIRGANVFAGYLGDVAPRSHRDGWFLTGDLGYLDDDGYLFLTGRRKELINRAGEKIAPREVEEVLHRRAEVQTACVVGVPDPLYGEEVVAFVQLRPGHAFDPDALVAFCRLHLARFKAPKRILRVDDWPRAPNGKLQRRFLVDLYNRLTEPQPRSSP
ncbi:MAG: AMP-binding protein [Anaeromyxobacteraceae bacterium]